MTQTELYTAPEKRQSRVDKRRIYDGEKPLIVRQQHKIINDHFQNFKSYGIPKAQLVKICGIYKITNPKGAIYIGQSINIIRRWNEYVKLSGCGCNSRLQNSLKKYGVKRHEFEIVEVCGQVQLNEREIYYIELFQCFNSGLGMNLHSGGDNHTISEETRDKLRVSHLGQKAWNKGLTKEKDERLRISGEKHSQKMKGRKSSEETKSRISAAMEGKHHSEETKKKLSDAKKGNKVWLGRHHTEESKLKMRKPKLKKHEINEASKWLAQELAQSKFI